MDTAARMPSANGTATGEKPQALPVQPEAIPPELARPQWVAWRHELRKGKWTKCPYNPRTDHRAESNNPGTWATFGEALGAYRRGYDGVGFVFSESDEFFGIDLDACRDPATGELTVWAAEIVTTFNTYVETSPSGYGVKLMARGKISDGKGHVKKLSHVPVFGAKAPEIAAYDRGRFWCMTGHRLPSAQLCCEPRQQELEALLARLFPPKSATNGKVPKGKPLGKLFDRLLSNCAAAANGERSENDFSLCCAAVRNRWDREQVWGRIQSVGKFAERGREYFDTTWQRAESEAQPMPQASPISITTDALDLRCPSGRTDLANGRRLIARHGEDLHWCDAWGKWIVWDRTRWAIDSERRADALAKDIADDIWQDVGRLLSEVGNEVAIELIRFAKATAGARGIANMLALARSEPNIPIGPDKLDCDPWLLNCINGTLDLRTGKLQPHRPADLITKRAPVTFDPTAPASTWERFIAAVFDFQEPLINYVRRLAGYCLTGSTREHVLPVLYGVGANGKSTFANALLATLGTDYAIKAAPDLLMEKTGNAHPTERADLHGRRLVAAIESQDGNRLAETLVKELTGGDRVRARRMREDFWEFAPTHKVWLATNHKPIIRGQDVGIWRRVKLIPFGVIFTEAQQDKALPEKLQGELAGILNWALAGCLEWQTSGLGEPDEVKTATKGYRQAMDVLATFLDECCIFGEHETRAADMRAKYEEWCKANGEKPLGGRRFWEYLEGRGVTKHTNNGTVYDGIALLA